MKKIIFRISTLSQFNLNTQFFITLLDFATFVYVFNRKKRFSNFKRVFKGQGLLYSSNIIPIEGWGWISLSLKVKD